MKKWLKYLLFVLLGIVVLIGAFVAYIQIKGIPHYEVNMPAGLADLKVEVTPERIAHGEAIASMTCVLCHLGSDGKLSGMHMEDVPKEFGWIHSANITQHPEYGIKDWTDGQLMYMFRTSIRRDGSYVPPWMPSFPHAADEDLYSVIAFLRSNNALVQPSDHIAPDPKPAFLGKLLCNIAFKPFEYPDKPILRPDSTDQVALGRYLAVGLVDCYGCHSADFKTYDPLVPENTPGYFGGGNPLVNREGEIVRTANLTFHETGIAHYTKEEFIQTVKWGKKPDGSLVRYPMVPHTTLTDYEAGAIYEYLKTIPKIDNAVDRK